MEKKCNKCGIVKPLTEFHKRTSAKDNHRGTCKECLKEPNREYRKKNREKRRAYNEQWNKDNRDKYLATRKRNNKKLRTCPIFRLSESVSSMVRKRIRKQGDSTFQHLPYTVGDLREHLENQFDDNMTWENYGSYWHIDHIYPQSLLPYDSFQHPNFLKCWSLDNLQPLEGSENIRKSNKVHTDESK